MAKMLILTEEQHNFLKLLTLYGLGAIREQSYSEEEEKLVDESAVEWAVFAKSLVDMVEKIPDDGGLEMIHGFNDVARVVFES